MKVNICIVYGFFIMLVLAFTQTTTLNAQVTIGSGESPNKDALLDLKETNAGSSSKGFLYPRVALVSTTLPSPLSSHTEGMYVYNTATVNDVTPGSYYNNGSKWIRLQDAGSATISSYFYMPSIVLPMDTTDPSYDATTETFTIDLYSLYSAQFGLTNSGSSTKNAAATTLPVIAKTSLDYFITYYDTAAFSSVAVDDSGVLTYKLSAAITMSEKTFMNIVLKVK